MTGTTVIVDLSRRPGGAQRRIAAVLHGARSTRELHLVCLRSSGLAAVDFPRVSTTVLDRRRWDPRLVTDLLRVYRLQRAAVVDAHNVTAQFWAVLAGRIAGVPRLVCTVHSDYSAEHSATARGRLYPMVIRLAALLGAGFVAVDASVAGFLRSSGVSVRRLIVIPNAAVDDETIGLGSTDLDRDGLRRRLGAGDRFVTLFAGRLEPVKDVDTLLEAIARPELAAIDAQLWIAGDGSRRAALEQRARDLGVADRARFLGEIDDVTAHMYAADVVALVSRSEGLPYVVLEAAAAGRPMVLSRVGSLVDLLGADGACFVEPGDPIGVAGALAHLAADDARRAGIAERASVRLARRLPASALPEATRAFYGETVNPRSLIRSAVDVVGRRTAAASFRVVREVMPATSRRDVLHVLTYHRIAVETSDASFDPVLRSASPDEFAAQMSMIRERFHPVSLDEVEQAMTDGAPLPPRAVLVTFDDAYAELRPHALPALRAHAVPAVVFVPTAYPDSEGMDFWWDRLYRALLVSERPSITTPVGTFALDRTADRASLVANAVARHVKTLSHAEAMALVDELVDVAGGTVPLNGVLTWDELAEFAEQGVTIESHSRTHAALDQLPEAELRSELVGSADDIERRVGRRPLAIAYPTGQLSPTVTEHVRAAGYRVGFTTVGGSNELTSSDALQLRRIHMSRAVDAAALEVLLGPAGRILQRARG